MRQTTGEIIWKILMVLIWVFIVYICAGMLWIYGALNKMEIIWD